MDIIIMNTVCLPIRTGPSNTGIIRANFLESKGHRVTMCFPYITKTKHQLAQYGKTFTLEQYREYLIRGLGKAIEQIDGQGHSHSERHRELRVSHARAQEGVDGVAAVHIYV